MRKSAIGLALLCVLGAGLSTAADAPPAPGTECRLKLITSIDLDISPGGVVHVPVSISGTEAWMTLVTTKATTIVSDSIATALKLPRRDIVDVAYLHVGGKEVRQLVSIDAFRIGDLEFRSAELHVNPVSSTKSPTIENGRPLAGVLGINVFDRMDFELNLAAKKLNLFSQDHCPGKVVYWTTDYSEMPFTKDSLGTIVFPLELDGKSIETTFATSYSISALDSNISRRVYGFDENSPDVTRVKADSGREDNRFKAMALTAPGLNITNTQVRLYRGDKDCGQTWRTANKIQAAGYSRCTGGVPMNLGMNILTKLRIYVANREKVIYVSRSDAK